MELTEEQVELAETLAGWLNYQREAVLNDYSVATLTRAATGAQEAYQALEASGVKPNSVLRYNTDTHEFYVLN